MRYLKSFIILAGLFALAHPAMAAEGDPLVGDPDAGAKVFKKCQTCHNVEEAKNKVGPYLTDVIGRQPGTVPDFKYSKAMTEFGQGKVWSEELLTEYLPDPRGLVKGTKMTFAGLKKPQEVADVIAYLKQFSKADQ